MTTIIYLEIQGSVVIFRTACGHWHQRPAIWKIKIGDDFSCPYSECEQQQ